MQVEKTVNEIEHKKKGGMREGVFKIYFYLSLFYSDLIGYKLH